jgi:hypothetical protein
MDEIPVDWVRYTYKHDHECTHQGETLTEMYNADINGTFRPVIPVCADTLLELTRVKVVQGNY